MWIVKVTFYYQHLNAPFVPKSSQNPINLTKVPSGEQDTPPSLKYRPTRLEYCSSINALAFEICLNTQRMTHNINLDYG